MEDRTVDHLEDPMEDYSVGRKVDHLEVPMEDHSVDLMQVRLVDRKVGHLEDLMEAQKGRVVTKAASLLSERLVLLGPVQVVQLVVKEEAMEQARIVPV